MIAPPQFSLTKYITLLILGLLLLISFAYAGYWYGTRQTPPAAKTETIISSEITAADCKVKVTTNKREILLDTNIRKFAPRTECYQLLQNLVSPSGKFVVFEDVSGGVDSQLRVYTLQNQNNASHNLDVFGTAKVFHIQFLPDDKLAVLSGYQGVYDEQILSIYDLSGLYQNYPSDLEEYRKRYPLPDIGKDYSYLSVSGGSLKIYGAHGMGSDILKEYRLEDLAEDPIGDWEEYKIEGIGSYKLPPKVSEPPCDQSSCLSMGTNLPGGSRFTLAVHGEGRALADSWEEFERDLKEAGLTLGKTSLQGKAAQKFSGRLAQAVFYFAPSSGVVEGFVVKLSENIFIDVSIFAGDNKDVDFYNDQILFSQILATFQFLN